MLTIWSTSFDVVMLLSKNATVSKTGKNNKSLGESCF